MIEKKIHYIWVGEKEKSELFKNCIASWSKLMPEYKIIRWNESNLNLNKYKFAQDAYDAEKFAFATDVLRYDILFEHGGIFLDADVEVIKKFDDLLHLKAFTGFEQPGIAAPGLILAAQQGCSFLQDIIDIYKRTNFNKKNIALNEPSPAIMTRYLNEKGLTEKNEIQTVGELTVFPTEYFCPMNYLTKKIKMTNKTYSIHHYAASWVPRKSFWKKATDIPKNLVKLLIGKKATQKIQERRRIKRAQESNSSIE